VQTENNLSTTVNISILNEALFESESYPQTPSPKPPPSKTKPAGNGAMWLSIYFTAIPVGIAIGYIYGSCLASSIGWYWAYFIEAAVMIPLFLATFPLRQSEIERQINRESMSFASRVTLDQGKEPLLPADSEVTGEQERSNALRAKRRLSQLATPTKKVSPRKAR